MSRFLISALLVLGFSAAHAEGILHSNDFAVSQRHLVSGGYGSGRYYAPQEHWNDFSASQRHLRAGGYSGRYHCPIVRWNDYAASQRHLTGCGCH